MSAIDRYRELTAKVDAFFARVQARHADDMLCGSGCHDCCHVQLSVTSVEAATIRARAATLPQATRDRLAARAAREDPERCAALEDDGRCAIYDARPLVCRSHGVPIRQREPGGAATVSTCFRNFTERGAAAADPDCVLDQTTLSTLLLAIDAAHAGETGGAPGARIALAAILRR
ncbi:MAG: YkgJ family cysteine cluster protein [bacterium]